MTYTNIPYSTVEFEKSKFYVEKRSTEKIASNILNGKALFNYSNQVVKVVPADIIRYASQSRILTSDDLYRSTVINFILSCEKNCAGSGILFLMLLDKDFSILGNRKIRLEHVDLKSILNFYLGAGDISKGVLDVFDNCGFEFNLKFSQSPFPEIRLIQNTSQKVQGHIDPAFYGTSIDSDFVLMCVDGKIESLGEIDPLLQWSSSNSKQVLLVAKSFSPDVSNTLKVNWDSGKLSVMPFIVEEEGLNFISKFGDKIIALDSGLRFNNVDFDSYDSIAIKSNLENSIFISTREGDASDIEFLLPPRLASMHSLIEERVKCGTAIIKNSLMNGVNQVQYKQHVLTVPDMCLKYAKRALVEWEKIKNISCVVTLQQKINLSNQRTA